MTKIKKNKWITLKKKTEMNSKEQLLPQKVQVFLSKIKGIKFKPYLNIIKSIHILRYIHAVMYQFK